MRVGLLEDLQDHPHVAIGRPLVVPHNLDGASPHDRAVGGSEAEALRAELTEMARYLRNLDARLDFTERLLDGALAPAPAHTTGPEPTGADAQSREPRPDA